MKKLPLTPLRPASPLPTFIRLDSKGNEETRSVGYMDQKEFRAWLVSAASPAAPSSSVAAHERTLLDGLIKIDAYLRSGDPETVLSALDVLAELAAAKDDENYEDAGELLRKLVKEKPEVLLPVLNSDSLAKRIAVTNAFVDVLGDSFEFDPWSSKEERVKGVEAVKALITKSDG